MTYDELTYLLLGFLIGAILLYIVPLIILVAWTEISIKWGYRDKWRG